MPIRRNAICTFILVSFLALPIKAQSTGNDNSKTPQSPCDLSNWLALAAAAEGGGGWHSGSSFQTSGFAGVKLGLPAKLTSGYPPRKLYTFTLDLGYDRARLRDGFSTELSVMLPLWRNPGPQKDQKKNYLRVYAEPGAGYRWGGGLGGYWSAKLMMAFFSDERLTSTKTKWSPFLEVQRRFPLAEPLNGDTRITFGLMWAICNHCGLE